MSSQVNTLDRHPINTNQKTYGLHPVLWLWIPIIWMVGQIAAEIIFPAQVVKEFHGENGLHEWLQFGFMIGVFGIAVHAMMIMKAKQAPWVFAWIAIAAICSFYVAFEEISWGQWIFNWQTPDHIADINYQGETNLHNTSKWLNQKPRLLLEIGIILGGIIIPVINMTKPKWLPQRFNIIYPPNFLIVIASIYTVAKFSHKFSRMIFDEKIFQRSSEIEELYLYFFILLYMIVIHKRIRKIGVNDET